MLGNISGLFIMSLLTIFGLSAIILKSAPLFYALKTMGAVYLVYLGIKIWRQGFSFPNAPQRHQTSFRDSGSFGKLYTQGILLSLSNPKAIGFTTALFPQFIAPQISLVPQFTILVATLMALSFLCLFAYAVLVGRVMSRSKGSGLTNTISKLLGSVFIGSGIALAVKSPG